MAEDLENLNTPASGAVNYDESHIKHLDARDHVRARLGMYIGRAGDGSHPDDGIYVLLKEVVDNGVDEFIMNFGRRLDITITEDNTVSVRDYGRGIPQGKLVECVSDINTGGKYDTDAFQFSVGMNGVGVKAVNFLSETFIARSIRSGHYREVTFKQGILDSDVEGDTEERDGTLIVFRPDPEIFHEFRYRMSFVEKRLWMYAYLNTGLSIYLNDQRFYSKEGLKDLLTSEVEDNATYDVIHYKSKTLEFAFTHSDEYGQTYFSFVNGQHTTDGGTHQSAFCEGILKAINDISGKNYQAADVRDGITGAIAIKMQNPVFESQTKNKLGSTEVRGPIVQTVKDEICNYLLKNVEIKDILLDKISRNEQVRRKVQEVKKSAKETSQKTVLRIPKLKDCKYHIGSKWPRGVQPKETMIFLTEGQSAAGSLEKRRDPDCQAIFELRGKPKNSYGETFEMIYKNEELTFLMKSLGVEDSTEFLRYDKIILATDADVDGLHIRNLMITFFLCFFDQLVLSGHLYVLETPLYRVRKTGTAPIYCYSDSERDKAVAKLGKAAEITRFKGLGEISPDDFGVFIGKDMRLSPVTLDNMHGVNDMLKFYMGENSVERKNYIMNNLEVTDYE
ncbi:MAG: type IIA DNA topoisomerase subunit B [Lentisphaeria bacterium]|nr:type IIA DNA topoisomerase subunit B [Lentisphaeria bacterium]